MPWPIPSAQAIFERAAGTVETLVIAVRPAVDPVALSRAVRSARGMFAILLRTLAMQAREIHDHVAWWSRQYFPDTAEDEFAFRHASIWGVEHRGATTAVGTVTVEGIAGTVVPAGTEFASSEAVSFTTDAVAAIGIGGSVDVAVTAAMAGPTGNLEAGIRLVVVTPFPQIGRITVAGAGIAGGAAEETPAELAAATVARIRQPPHGGAGFDYPAWLRGRFDVRAVKVVTDWVGRGSVGVIVAIQDDPDGRAPTEDEVGEMLAFLGAPGSASGVRPVTAKVVVVAAAVTPLAISVRLRPDTVAVRAAVTEAFSRYIATLGDADDDQNESPIGAIIEPSRISEAISAASGEYAHDLVVPAARYTLAATAFPTPGVITFLEPL